MFRFYEMIVRKFLFFNRWQYRFNKEVSQAIKEINKEKSEKENIAFIAEEVKNKGVFILNEALSSSTLQAFRKEYNKFFESEESQFYAVDKHDGAVCIRVKPLWTVKNMFKFPITLSFFNVNSFDKITKRFYKNRTDKIHFMSEIFVHNTPETTEPLSGGLHWDRAQTLKFWIYLNDLEVENGPMRIELDSVQKNAAIRSSAKDPSKLVGGVDNIVEPENEVVYLTAPAGSVMIHDTDASHGATPVAKGKQRQIIRGHCRAN